MLNTVDSLTETASDVMSTLFDLDFHHASRPVSVGNPSAMIRFRGLWNGVLVVECERSLAAFLALHFRLCKSVAEADEDAIEDSVAELANIMAGNLKCVLPGEPAISTPQAVGELPGEDKTRVELTCSHGAVVFTLIETSA